MYIIICETNLSGVLKLEDWCRKTILESVNEYQIDMLPLPESMKLYLLGKQRGYLRR